MKPTCASTAGLGKGGFMLLGGDKESSSRNRSGTEELARTCQTDETGRAVLLFSEGNVLLVGYLTVPVCAHLCNTNSSQNVILGCAANPVFTFFFLFIHTLEKKDDLSNFFNPPRISVWYE